LATVAQIKQPNAIFGIGDNIYDDWQQPSFGKIVEYWSAYYLRYQSLKRDWYLVTGNHEYWWNGGGQRGEQYQKDFTTHLLNSGGYWNMPALWYDKSFRTSSGVTIDAFFIDTMIWKESAGSRYSSERLVQRNWLALKLEDSAADWKIVVGHHPVYSQGQHGITDELLEDVEGLDSLDPLMRRYGVQFYLSGHDHSQQHMYHRGLNYIISGAGGKTARYPSNEYPRDAMLNDQEGLLGFAGLQICSGSSATLKFYGEAGDTLYSANVDIAPPNSEKEQGIPPLAR
jgi:acid phosphatase